MLGTIMKNRKKAKNKGSKDSVQSSMPFDQIEDYLKLKDGLRRVILRISPVNQDNLVEEELDDIVEQLQEIFNSDPGSIQIKVSSEPMNMDLYEDYVNDIASRHNNAYYLERTQSYKDYFQQRKKNSKNQKRFYMTLLSQQTDFELAKEDLKSKIAIVQENLDAKDMKGILLKADDIKDLFYRKLNPITSQYQPFDVSMSDSDILPAHIHYMPEKNYVEMDGMFYRYFAITYYPEGKKNAGWFKKIINSKGNVEVDIFALPGDKTNIEKGLSNSIGTLEVRLEENPAPYLKTRYKREIKSQEKMLEEIQDDAAYQLTVMVTIYEDSYEKLETASKRIVSTIKSNQFRSKTLNHRYLDPFYLNLPILYNSPILKKFNWQMHSRLIASIMPFDSSEITSQTGAIWGYNPDTESFIIVDRFDRKKHNNGNGVTFGGSGSGKTFLNSTEIDRNITLNIVDRIVVIDPEREYLFPYGERINFEVGGTDCTNPFHFRSTILDDDDDKKDGTNHAGRFMLKKTSDVVTWTKWIYRDQSPEETSLISRAVRQCYKHQGLDETMEHLPDGYIPPTLETFKKIAKNEPKLSTTLNILDPYIDGEYKSLFNGQTSWDLNDRLTILDIANVQKEVQQPLYDLIFKEVWSDFKRDRNERTALYADEAHQLVNKRDPQSLDYIVNCYKRFRKYMSYIEIITQNIDDILSVGRDAATQILANSSFKKYLYMQKKDLEALQEIETISKKELSVIRKKSNKGRGIVVVDDHRAFIQSEASLDQLAFIDPKLYAQITEDEEEEEYGESA
ncbi:conjugal transfer ATP-binding protein TraC [Paenibacillus polymyxa]